MGKEKGAAKVVLKVVQKVVLKRWAQKSDLLSGKKRDHWRVLEITRVEAKVSVMEVDSER